MVTADVLLSPCKPVAQISSFVCVTTLKGDVTTADEDGGGVRGKSSEGVNDVRAERVMGDADFCLASHC